MQEEILLTRRDGHYKGHRGQEIFNTKSRINKRYIKRAMLSNLSAYQRETLIIGFLTYVYTK